MTPVATTLDTAEPEIEPNRAEAVIAILAEPPRNRPIRASEVSVKNDEPPDLNRIWPKNTKATTMVEPICIGRPSIADWSQAR